MSVLDVPPAKGLEHFAELCELAGLNSAQLTRDAVAEIRHLNGVGLQPRRLKALEARWYASLQRGEPDWGVYADDSYMAELWACWAVHSRRDLRKFRALVLDQVSGVGLVIDLGCGFGFTTAVLAELFPNAVVYGTNLSGTVQAALASVVGRRYRFSVVGSVKSISESGGLLYASEYFEHVQAPVEHFAEIVGAVKPSAMLIASTFNKPSIGHFDEYLVDGKLVNGKTASSLFDDAVRGCGYSRVKTRFWNQRPAYWVKA